MKQFRKSPRACFLDYDGGDYFVTICTKDRKNYFGFISNDDMHLSEIGKYVEYQIKSASDYCTDIDIPLFVVMPNHAHFIISLKYRDVFSNHDEANIQQRSPNPALRINSTDQRHVPLLSRYVSSLKGAVTKYAKTRNIVFGWQKRYHEHFIRGNNDGNRISEYIQNNVAKWQDDCFHNKG